MPNPGTVSQGDIDKLEQGMKDLTSLGQQLSKTFRDINRETDVLGNSFQTLIAKAQNNNDLASKYLISQKLQEATQNRINEIKSNNEIKLYYDGDFIRDYMHVHDVCNAINFVIHHAEYNQIINIGSGIPQKFRDVIDFVIKETNSSSKITAIDAVDFHKIVQVKDMYADVTKLNKLGFKQQINIYKGIKTLL